MHSQPVMRLRKMARVEVMFMFVMAAMLATLVSGNPAQAHGAVLAEHAAVPPPEVQQARLDGQTACAQPPSALDPTALSDVQIATYGFTPRPDQGDPNAMAAWAKVVSSLHHRYCTSHPGTARNGSESSTIWAGYVNTGYGYTAAESDWDMPYASCTSGTSTDASYWVGLGGDGNNGGGNLVQDGFEQYVNSNCGEGRRAWYEDWCTLDPVEQIWDGFQVWDGNGVYAYCDSNYSISDGNYYSVSDYTTGGYATAAEYSYPSNGSTGEVIAERPSFNGTPSALTNFGIVGFNSGETRRNGIWSYINQLSYTSVTMYNSYFFGHVLANPGSMGNYGTFNVYFDATS